MTTTTDDAYLIKLIEDYKAALAAQERAVGDESAYREAHDVLRKLEVSIAAYVASVLDVKKKRI